MLSVKWVNASHSHRGKEDREDCGEHVGTGSAKAHQVSPYFRCVIVVVSGLTCSD